MGGIMHVGKMETALALDARALETALPQMAGEAVGATKVK